MNEILGLHFDGHFVEGVQPLKAGIRDHFEKHFQQGEGLCPQLGGWNFPKLNEVESNFLVAPFTEEEIREAMWNCDSNKSPGPDGVTFSFIK